MRFFRHRQPLSFLLVLATLFTVFNILPSTQAADSTAAILSGQTLYTQFSFFYEKERHLTTNYRQGVLVPVNTEVKLVKMTDRQIVVILPYGQEISVQNVEDFSGENIDGIFNRTFSKKPVDLSPFTEDEKKAIMTGSVKIGMRRSAVIVALGYPPKHKTPGLELNQWRYWQNRFNTFVVVFENDKVKQIIN